MPVKIKAAIIKIKASVDKIKAAPDVDKIKAAEDESLLSDLEALLVDEPESVDKLKFSIDKIKAAIIKIKAKIKANDNPGDAFRELSEHFDEFEKSDWINSLADEDLKEKIEILEQIVVDQAVEIYKMKNRNATT